MQEHKPVGIAHSSEEMFEHDDCNALNALDFLAPPFASRQKVEEKIRIIVNLGLGDCPPGQSDRLRRIRYF